MRDQYTKENNKRRYIYSVREYQHAQGSFGMVWSSAWVVAEMGRVVTVCVIQPSFIGSEEWLRNLRIVSLQPQPKCLGSFHCRSAGVQGPVQWNVAATAVVVVSAGAVGRAGTSGGRQHPGICRNRKKNVIRTHTQGEIVVFRILLEWMDGWKLATDWGREPR